MIDPGLQRCPNCGLIVAVCECTEDDMNRWAYDQLYGDDEPGTYYNYSYDALDNFYEDADE